MPGLHDKVKDSAELDAAVAIAVEGDCGTGKTDPLKAQVSRASETSDEEFAGISGVGFEKLSNLRVKQLSSVQLALLNYPCL
jgi:hypothetical protein